MLAGSTINDTALLLTLPNFLYQTPPTILVIKSASKIIGTIVGKL